MLAEEWAYIVKRSLIDRHVAFSKCKRLVDNQKKAYKHTVRDWLELFKYHENSKT